MDYIKFNKTKNKDIFIQIFSNAIKNLLMLLYGKSQKLLKYKKSGIKSIEISDNSIVKGNICRNIDVILLDGRLIE